MSARYVVKLMLARHAGTKESSWYIFDEVKREPLAFMYEDKAEAELDARIANAFEEKNTRTFPWGETA